MANTGDGSRIQVDLTRWEDQELDISGKFNGRVGDTQDWMPLWIKSNGFPTDLRNWKVIYGGTDSKMVVHRHVIENISDVPAKQGDSPAMGKFTLPIDAHTFNVPGKWNQFFIQFINDNGETVSTIDLGFDVFDNTFFAHMGNAEQPYIEEFEKILQSVTDAGTSQTDKINKFGDDFMSEMKDWVAKYKQSLDDALSAVNDPKDGLLVRYSSLLSMTKEIQQTLKDAQFHNRMWQFSDVGTMKQEVELMAGDIAVTQGWDDYDDGHGGFWNIRVKHRDETPDEQTTLSLTNGMVAERNSSLITADSLEDVLYGYTIEIKHNQGTYPVPHVFYYEDAIGTEIGGLGKTDHGFGETKTKLIPSAADYSDPNTIKVKIPRNFMMKQSPHYSGGAWYLRDENRTLKIDLGTVDETQALAGDSHGKSYLSAGTGYFSDPVHPSDLRAVYIDQNTQRLLWRM